MNSTHKINSVIEQECKHFIADIATSGEELKTQHPDADIEIRRSPERITFQAGKIGFSFSWFKSRPGEELGASIMVAGWEGQITFPGQTPLEGRSARLVSETIFQLTLCDDSGWKWTEKSNTSPHTITSRALVERCISEIEARLLAQ